MISRLITAEEKDNFNKAVTHPLQSYEWGQFRKKMGQQVERVGFFENNKLVSAIQLTFHDIPVIGKRVGYLPKGLAPDKQMLTVLEELANKQKALYIKLEPNIYKNNAELAKTSMAALRNAGGVEAKSLFTRYNFVLDLQKPEDELFANLQSKTRYNVKLSHRKGVRIYEDSSQKGLEQYLEILAETTKRQGFYAHSSEYFRTMWESLQDSGMMHIFHAEYQGTILVSWVMFIFNGVLYYPYGASRNLHRNVMASNLMMWEMIKYGQKQKCQSFDMWGALPPEAGKKNPWYGFHRFKQGYNPEHVEYLGSFDIVYNNFQYRLFQFADNLRWKYLKAKRALGA